MIPKKLLVMLLMMVVMVMVLWSGVLTPKQMISTPEGVYEWDGGYVMEVSGQISMLKDSYNIDEGEFPEFPMGMRVTIDGSGQYHDTLDGMVINSAAQLRARTNGVIVYDGWFNTIWNSELHGDYGVETREFQPQEADSSGVMFSDLVFEVGDTFTVEVYTDGWLHGNMWHDDPYGGYYEWDDWSMSWATTVASWECDITGGGAPTDSGSSGVFKATSSGNPPIPDATIYLNSTMVGDIPDRFTDTTDSDGRWEIFAPAGDYSLVIVKEGWSKVTYMRDIRDGIMEYQTLYSTIKSQVEPGRLPEVSITAIPTSGLAPLEVKFSAEVTDDGTIMSYQWYFGDGKSGTTQNPYHEYVSNGTYKAVLVVTDDEDNQASANIEIDVGDAPPSETDWNLFWIILIIGIVIAVIMFIVIGGMTGLLIMFLSTAIAAIIAYSISAGWWVMT